MTTATPKQASMPFPFRPESDDVILKPELAEPGYWVGCPTVHHEPSRDRFYLTYRERRPRGVEPERGWRLALAESLDGLSFTDIWSLEKSELKSSSMEGACLLPRGDGWTLLISYVDPADNRWRIDAIDADDPRHFDVTTARPVLTAHGTGTEGVKDPIVVKDGAVWYLLASFAAADTIHDVNRAQAHHNADIYTTGLTTHPTGLATSVNGTDWTWHGSILDVGAHWDRYQSRITAVVPSGRGWLGFYDGSASAAENYEEKVGLAVSTDLRSWLRLTPDGPLLTTAEGTGSVRYASAVPRGDELWLYYECANADGSHDLRRAVLPSLA